MLAALAVLAGLVLAAPAGAVVTDGSRVSVQPIDGTAGSSSLIADPLDGTAVGVTYHGGPVVHGLTTYAVYWDPAGSIAPTAESLVNNFLAGTAHDSGATGNVFSVASQYGDAGGGAQYQQTFGGSYIDSDPYPTTDRCSETTASATICLTNSQEVSELTAFVGAHKLPTGLGAVYVVMTPDTVVTCTDGTDECSNNSYCSLHSFAPDGSSTLLYIEIPFTLLDSPGDAKSCQDDGNTQVQAPNPTAGLTDVALKSLSHELLETITDPMLNAWYDADGNEVADLCNGLTWNADSFLPTDGGSATAGTLWNQTIDGGHYYLQGAWSNALNGCALASAPGPVPSFSVPANAVAGSAVSLSASSGTTTPIASYSWSFGDGADATGQSALHTYAAAGDYTVTLSVADSYGATGSASEPIVVAKAIGTTAGAAGAKKAAAKVSCGRVRRGSRGAETRRCTKTTVAKSASVVCKTKREARGVATAAKACHTVVRTTTHRQSCSERRPEGVSKWAERCAEAVVVRSRH